MHDDSQTLQSRAPEPGPRRIEFPRKIDANAVAEQLIREFGMDRALEQATEGTFGALKDGDNYQLSVWREVKFILYSRGRANGASAR